MTARRIDVAVRHEILPLPEIAAGNHGNDALSGTDPIESAFSAGAIGTKGLGDHPEVELRTVSLPLACPFKAFPRRLDIMARPNRERSPQVQSQGAGPWPHTGIGYASNRPISAVWSGYPVAIEMSRIPESRG